jgi:hypothetical protein
VRSDEIKERFFWPEDWRSTTRIFNFYYMYEVRSGWAFPCGRFRAGELHLWLQMAAPASDTE